MRCLVSKVLMGVICFGSLLVSAAEFNREERHNNRLDTDQVKSVFLGQPLNKVQLSASLDLTDLLISSSISPSTFDQGRGSLVALADSGWLAIWEDDRMGSTRIFGQLLDLTAQPLGDNLMLAGSNDGADYVDPLVKVDTLGRLYLFYRDQTNGLIFGSRLQADLTPDLSPFLVNDTDLTTYAGPLAMDVYPDGRMVVVWENYSSVGSTIQMRLYSPSGNSLLPPTTVNNDGGLSQHWVPSVAVKPGGGFLVGWEDYRNGRADIYAALYDGNGSAIGGNFPLVPPPDNSADQFAPEVVYSATHDYLIGWLDQRSGQEVYLQRYSPLSGAIGSNIKVSNSSGGKINWDVALAVDGSGGLAALWASFAAANYIEAVRFDNALNPSGPSVILNSSMIGQRWGGALDFRTKARPGVIWTERESNNADLVMAELDSNLIPIAGEIVLNDDSVGALSTDPTMVASGNWWNQIAWVDRRNDIGDIYLRTVADDGTLLDVEHRVNMDQGNALQAEPALAALAEMALIVWVDGRSVSGLSGQRIYGRWLDRWGGFMTDEFRLSDELVIATKSEPKATLSDDGSGLVVWIDKRAGSPQVRGVWLNISGTVSGTDFEISNPVSDLENGYLSCGSDASGRYFVIWLDYGQSAPTVKGHYYHADRSDGGAFSWTPSVPSVQIDELAAAVAPAGSIRLFWSGTTGLLYLAEIDSLGGELTGSFETSQGLAVNGSGVKLSVSENDFCSLVWLDSRSGRSEVFYQLYDNNLVAINGNQRVSLANPDFMAAPATYARRGRAWFVWADPRADGMNIYAGNTLYLSTAVEEESGSLPTAFELRQNYPNPFNPSTTISFQLNASTEIELRVINLLGQSVVILADGFFGSGEHEVVWDGRSSAGRLVASGIYFYRLQTSGYSQQRKMLLLK